jgi:hypothetical protein
MDNGVAHDTEPAPLAGWTDQERAELFELFAVVRKLFYAAHVPVPYLLKDQVRLNLRLNTDSVPSMNGCRTGDLHAGIGC